MATSFVNTNPQFTINTGGNFAPNAGGEVEFFAVGTTGSSNRKDTYNTPTPDATPTTAQINPNPVPLDSYGRFSVPVFLDGSYNTVIRDSAGNQVDTKDNVVGEGSEGVSSIVVQDVTALAALDTNLYASAYVIDSKGRFNFSSGSALADNGTTIIEPDVGSGRWLKTAIVPVNRRVVTASETYTPPVNISVLEFELVGAGGGSGGCSTTGGASVSSGGGGGGGGYVKHTTSTIAASYTITIGAGGTGGAAGDNDGTAGGDTIVTDGASFTLTASGGALGQGAADSENASAGAGGAATGGTINYAGSKGDRSIGSASPVASTLSNTYGGDSYVQRGTDGPTANNVGVAGVDYGGGAAGPYNSLSQTQRAGAAGGDGVLILTEYL